MTIDTAVVLAGGSGNRLKPLTNDIPKGMIEVYGKPLLQWIIEWLRDNSVRKIILGVAYQKEKIQEYFGDGKEFGVDIKYSVHTVEGGTSEGFRLAISRYIDSDVFFAMNGDQITGLNLGDLASFHMKNNPVATMVVAHPTCPYGQVHINDKNDVIGFVEKPPCSYTLCNIGIYAFNREILQYLPERGDVEKEAFPVLARLHRLKVYPFHGFFITVNTFKDFIKAEEELKNAKKTNVLR